MCFSIFIAAVILEQFIDQINDFVHLITFRTSGMSKNIQSETFKPLNLTALNTDARADFFRQCARHVTWLTRQCERFDISRGYDCINKKKKNSKSIRSIKRSTNGTKSTNIKFLYTQKLL